MSLEVPFTGLLECVQTGEGLRRDGACDHGVFQKREDGEAPLHEPARVCLLIHVGVAQASTHLQERQRVSRVAQVRDGCDIMPAYPI